MSVISNLNNALNKLVQSGNTVKKVEESKTKEVKTVNAQKAVDSKISNDAKSLKNNLISADEILRHIPGISKGRAQEIADNLANNIKSEKSVIEKPQSLRQLRDQRLKNMFDVSGLQSAAKRISEAVENMDALAHTRMGELSAEFAVLQQKITIKAREIVEEEPKSEWQQVQAKQKRSSLLELIAKSEGKREESLKKLSELSKYGPQKQDVYEKLYGNFGGTNTSFSDKVKEISRRIMAQAQ